jgi:hypothetical protein
MSLPQELEDAAKIDGLGHVGIYRRIMLPQVEPVYEPVLRVVDGGVPAPTAPGWGISLDPAFARDAELTCSSV